MLRSALARLRVPLGFGCGLVVFWIAAPTPASVAIGMSVAAVGEVLRLWAAGHVDKGREVTRSGPYRFVRHPLYLGSAIMGTGFVLAARSWIVAVIVFAYLGATLVAAMHTEEAVLLAKFGGEYAAYREGHAGAVDRPFSLARLMANREYRAAAGFVLVVAFLMARAWWGR